MENCMNRQPSEDEAKYIREALYRFNDAAVGEDHHTPLNLVEYGADGEIIGGILGDDTVEEEYHIDKAESFLKNMYKDVNPVTGADYEVVGQVRVAGVAYTAISFIISAMS